MPPDQAHYCSFGLTVMSVTTISSTLLILIMTFECFYSIIRPHKAASFNTVKGAKITIVSIIFICILFSIPHLFVTTGSRTDCFPFFNGRDLVLVKMYSWLYQIVALIFPFLSLLMMNSVIIHTLHKRSKSLLRLNKQGANEGQTETQSSKMTTSEKQIIIMLLSITFGFLIFMTPSAVNVLYVRLVDFKKSPKLYVVYLYVSIAEKAHFTNFGINFLAELFRGMLFKWKRENKKSHQK